MNLCLHRGKTKSYEQAEKSISYFLLHKYGISTESEKGTLTKSPIEVLELVFQLTEV